MKETPYLYENKHGELILVLRDYLLYQYNNSNKNIMENFYRTRPEDVPFKESDTVNISLERYSLLLNEIKILREEIDNANIFARGVNKYFEENKLIAVFNMPYFTDCKILTVDQAKEEISAK